MYRICANCVLDTQDSNVEFDAYVIIERKNKIAYMEGSTNFENLLPVALHKTYLKN